MRRRFIPALTLVLATSYLGASTAVLRARPAVAPPLLPPAQQAATGTRSSVWDGVFTADQAERGRKYFSVNCAECHGDNLEGGEGKALAGDAFWSRWRETTVGELLTYARTNMPFSEDGSKKGTLATNIYVDIVTYILKANGLPAGMQELTPASSVGVQIIAEGGPGELPASTVARVVGCLAPSETGGNWRLVMGTRPARASSPRSSPDRDVPLGDRVYELKFVMAPLTRLVGHRVSVTGLLLGDGGVSGLNVSSVDSVADICN